MANAARREDAEPVEEEAAFEALRAVAATKGCPVDRLRMTDYDAAVRSDVPGPSVAQVLATFDTWKAARAAAAGAVPAGTARSGERAEAAGAA